jgi:ActR/RegA family two-component response regulator
VAWWHLPYGNSATSVKSAKKGCDWKTKKQARANEIAALLRGNKKNLKVQCRDKPREN